VGFAPIYLVVSLVKNYAIITIAVLMVVLFVWVMRTPDTPQRWKLIKVGMTRTELCDILGLRKSLTKICNPEMEYSYVHPIKYFAEPVLIVKFEGGNDYSDWYEKKATSVEVKYIRNIYSWYERFKDLIDHYRK
jgi:hypothetical protein